jgi:hypothetical protein
MSSSSLGWNRNPGGNSASTMHTKLMDISLSLSLRREKIGTFQGLKPVKG